jgi:predicted metal-dependent peptidase
MEQTPQDRLTAVLMRIRGDHPFFGTLGFFATFHLDDSFATAATDGKDIWLNPKFVLSLEFNEYAGLIVHELLHAALQHCSRRRERNAMLWNIAADIVVNGIILNDTNYKLPQGALVDPELCKLSAEEVYEQLQSQPVKLKLQMIDLIEGDSNCPDRAQKSRELSSYWKSAISQAGAIAIQTGRGYGREGFGAIREIDELLDPTLGWRELLWQHVVSTPSDYMGFDRRFVWQGLYLDDVVGEKVQVAIAIDTSGSIIQDELTEFMSELQGMIDAYPNIEGQLFYADVDLYGPYEFDIMNDIPKPKGGGGTSFHKFFRYMRKHYKNYSLVCIYFTDGYGDFPKVAGDLDVIWVIRNGGIPSTEVPFGKVIRLGF